MANYPSVVTAFSTKVNGQVIDASDVNNVQTDVVAIETFVGTLSSTVGTLVYDIRGSGSNGGGHVQTANKGGTGQTSFTKGDLLIASSASVLSKQAVGTDGQVLLADSSQSNGVNWGAATATLPYAQDSGTGSVFAIAPVPCIISYVPGQIYIAKIQNANTIVSPALSVSSLVARKIVNVGNSSVLVGQISASTLSLFGYDGAASVMQLLNPVPHYVAGFGAPLSYSNANSIVQATTDGIVTAYGGQNNGTTAGITDSSNNPSTTVISNTGAAGVQAITFPVAKNNYWKVTTTGGTLTMYFTPIT